MWGTGEIRKSEPPCTSRRKGTKDTSDGRLQHGLATELPPLLPQISWFTGKKY